MKNKVFMTILLLSVLVCFSSVTALADSVISVNPLGFILGIYNVDFEQSIGAHTSMLVGGTYFSADLLGSKVNTLAAKTGMRFYKNEAAEGIYFGPVLSAGYATMTTTNLFTEEVEKSNYMAYTLGAVAGCQWITKGGFVFDFNLGVGYDINTDEEVEGGFGPTLGLRIGYEL